MLNKYPWIIHYIAKNNDTGEIFSNELHIPFQNRARHLYPAFRKPMYDYSYAGGEQDILCRPDAFQLEETIAPTTTTLPPHC